MHASGVKPSAELLADIEAGNLRKVVTEEVYAQLEPDYLKLKEKYGDVSHIKFDPERHLSVLVGDTEVVDKYENTRRLTMEELGLTNPKQISPIAVSDPFPLFTDEAIDIMRLELLEKEGVLEHARAIFNSTTVYQKQAVDCVMRGWVKRRGEIKKQFTHDAWKHPKTIELISKVAGVDLKFAMDTEIANTNINISSAEKAHQERIDAESELALKTKGGDDMPAVVGWHTDSPPFVCVLMISDTAGMIGGETYLRKGNGEITCVPGPRKGYACVLQGHLIEHLASKPRGATERITMVSSYVAEDPMVIEDSVLSTVKPEVNYASRYNDFYPEWIDYRVDILKHRLDMLKKTCNDSVKFDKSAAIDQLKLIDAYLTKTYTEMEVSPEEWTTIVTKG